MKSSWKKWLLMLLIVGIIAGYSAFFVRVHTDYQNSARWAKEQAQAKKPVDKEEIPLVQDSNKTSTGSVRSLQNKELGKITGQDWAEISADEKLKLVSTVLNGMRLTGSNIKADEKDLITVLDSFYAHENRKGTDIITAITYIGESQGLLSSSN